MTAETYAFRHKIAEIVARSSLTRVGTVLVALAIIFWRSPTTFTNPQFWGEDEEFFRHAFLDGWSSMTTLGYLQIVQYLVANLAAYASPIYAPTIYNYSAIALTLYVVWLITSPRLDMPAKPLLAIAVVVVPMGYEELGTLVNVQWILPIGAFAMLFMTPPTSKISLGVETTFMAVMALSGPFCIFLGPIFAWRAYVTFGNQRKRLSIMTAILASAAAIQCYTLSINPVPVPPPAPYPASLWMTLPFERISTNFLGADTLFRGPYALPVCYITIVILIVVALRPPFRAQKICMLIFAGAIAVGGMYKFRDALATQINATRYFYPGAVFCLWMICSASMKYRRVSAAVVAAIEITLLYPIRNTPRIPNPDDFAWKSWAVRLQNERPLIIPTAPPGWSVSIPADPRALTK